MPASQAKDQRLARDLAVRLSRLPRLLMFLISHLRLTASLAPLVLRTPSVDSPFGEIVPVSVYVDPSSTSGLITPSHPFPKTSCLLSSCFLAPEKRRSASAAPTPDTFDLAKGDDEEGVQVKVQEDGAGEQISAADYDPCLDRREDEHKRVWGTKEEPQDVEIFEEEEEDVDDMFAVATTTEKKVKKLKRIVVSPSDRVGPTSGSSSRCIRLVETCSTGHHHRYT